jgi:RimJ/RimL family protein N-acetyltransferase
MAGNRTHNSNSKSKYLNNLKGSLKSMDNPLLFIDKKGRPFIVRRYDPRDYAHLSGMYDAFSPKARFQGMPPYDKDTRENWLKKLIIEGDNILSLQENKVTGHVVLLPDLIKRDAECLIFIIQSHRGAGIGSALTRTAIKIAEGLGLKRIWLTVDAYNIRATKLYKKYGFSFSDIYRSASERMMVYNFG